MADTLRAVATLAWPVVVIVALVYILPTARRLLKNSQSVEVEVGGTKISVQASSDELRKLIEDLQNKVNELSEHVGKRPPEVRPPEMRPPAPPVPPAPPGAAAPPGTAAPPGAATPAVPPPRAAAPGVPAPVVPAPSRILWVDDEPHGNAYERARAAERGYDIEVATSTAEALNLLGSVGPAVIVSDMGRMENGRFNPTAGLDLVRALRDSGDQTPVVFYTSPRRLAQLRDTLDTIPGASYTDSPTELARILDPR